MKVTLAVLAVLCLTPAPDDLDERLGIAVERFAAAENVRGLAVVVDVAGERIAELEIGRMHFGGNAPSAIDRPMPAGCLMDLLTAALIVRQADEGELALDGDLIDLLPGLKWNGEQMTLHHLLTHTSGLPAYADLAPGAKAVEAVMGPDSGWKWLSSELLESSPGSCQTLRGSNTWLLGEVAQELAGEPLAAAIASNILGQLDELDGGFVDKLREELDETRVRVDLGGQLGEDPLANDRFDAAHLLLSAADLARLARGLGQGDIVGGGGFARMAGVHRTNDGSELGYAYGLVRAPLNEYRGYSFGGVNGHEWVHAAYYPGLDLSIGIVADADELRLGDLERALAREVFDLPSAQVEDRPLPREARPAYIGLYLLGCNQLEIRDTDPDGHLSFYGLGPVRELHYQGGDQFLADGDSDLRLMFRVEDGRAHSIVLIERGSTSIAVRMSTRHLPKRR